MPNYKQYGKRRISSLQPHFIDSLKDLPFFAKNITYFTSLLNLLLFKKTADMNSFVNFGLSLHLADCHSVTMPALLPHTRTAIC